MFKKNETLLFIGDSITDSGATYKEPDEIGNGFVRHINDFLKIKNPEKKLNIINKGIGGNKSIDLLKRWEKDVIKENPDLLFIFIGTNEILGKYFEDPFISDIDIFELNLINMIEQTNKKTNIKLMNLIPYTKKIKNQFLFGKDLYSKENLEIIKYNKTIEKIANHYNLTYINLYEDFKKLDDLDIDLTIDGIHPNSKGHMLIFTKILKTLKKEIYI
ncbi:GDSL-type esterase/lipase family protein [Oceanotoga sp. DSM 15011]|uniref:Lysophospholipase L1-like esterase n=1 Tax=Oceanotoga teriensis TaxID=515440 RepID=A0AA45C5W8_9BACT|nr:MULTISPECIES: GDSL-type esterase/lipase family protein [Oceanotoga]MDN5341803.1 hypothetical protein [Oceanotoga sp.]MDO7975716.1 GDSL-type esterase/lipase family protein [Oceanotoga teriensis]PWJ90536.1 lysophospholipase L1-like esterase [Oceanotoga teriensis]UYO99780.1 GDSL-type esterase/lipase family protein [Oceanotoga sp. DSM 15011]